MGDTLRLVVCFFLSFFDRSCFAGEVKRARLGGHIPGAANTPYRDFLTEEAGADGTYRVFKGLDGVRKVGLYYVGDRVRGRYLFSLI